MCYMEVHMPQGEGAVSGVVSGIFGIWACIGFNRRNDAEKCIRLVCEFGALDSEFQTTSSSSFEFDFELAGSCLILMGSKTSSCLINIKICIFA